MNSIIDKIIQNLKTINLEGPALYALVVFVLLAFFRKWLILFLMLLTIGLGWITQGIMLFNKEGNMELVTVPFLVYCIGGGAVLLLLIIEFFKFSI